MNFLTTPVMYGLLATTIAGGAAAGVQTYRLALERSAHLATKLGQAEDMQALADRAAQAATKAAQVAASIQQGDTEAVRAMRQENQDALRRFERVVADQHPRVREDRQCPPPDAVPADAGTAAGGDGAGGAYLPAAAVDRVLRVGVDADEVVRKLSVCQSLLEQRGSATVP